MNIVIILLFIIGYLGIAMEHLLQINKTAIALVIGVLCWTFFVLLSSVNKDITFFSKELAQHVAGIAEILFFLIGAMTIVELIDVHQGFIIITDKIKSKNFVLLLWIISLISFFLSSVLDNLTTAIVMVSMLRKIVRDDEQRKFFAGVVIIAANAGGAWSPIGDVTTTMLWIGGQISAISIIKALFLPSLICIIIPLIYLSWRFKGQTIGKKPTNLTEINDEEIPDTTPFERNIMLSVGLGALLFVPIFKTITHLPPYMGVLLGLGIVWLVGEILHRDKDQEERKPLTAAHALSRIDSSSILFFLGILLAISALESAGILKNLSVQLSHHIQNQTVIVSLIGIISAIVDNVPLLAATMGMYDLETYPMDSKIWEFLAYCTGTGGSILIIGSAAGIAVMGIEKISFGWYLRKISWLALIGYFAGAIIYLLEF